MNYIIDNIHVSTIGAILGLGYAVGAIYNESTQTRKIINEDHVDKKNEDDQLNETHYVALYKARFLCPKLTGTLYKFNGKYIDSSEFAKMQLNGTLSQDVKLMATMDAELKQLMKGETVNGCSKVSDISIWTLPNILPGGYQYYKVKYTPQSAKPEGTGFGRVWW
jgi:hypothetical protein